VMSPSNGSSKPMRSARSAPSESGPSADVVAASAPSCPAKVATSEEVSGSGTSAPTRDNAPRECPLTPARGDGVMCARSGASPRIHGNADRQFWRGFSVGVVMVLYLRLYAKGLDHAAQRVSVDVEPNARRRKIEEDEHAPYFFVDRFTEL